ncbi:MAG: hypothetical protein ACKV2V_11770, partial [Blastocatellia bacterium]
PQPAYINPQSISERVLGIRADFMHGSGMSHKNAQGTQKQPVRTFSFVFFVPFGGQVCLSS